MEYIGNRISFVRKEEELSIVISAYSDAKKNTLLLSWFIAWTLGGVAMGIYLFRVPPGQLKTLILVWLGFWLYFEYKVWKAFTWRKYGKEIIKIGRGILFYKRDNRGAGKIHNYQTAFIQNTGKYKGKPDDVVSQFMSSYWVIGGESLSFMYYGKEILFGMQLNEKDSLSLLKLVLGELKA
jgi:hypothetical protein